MSNSAATIFYRPQALSGDSIVTLLKGTLQDVSLVTVGPHSIRAASRAQIGVQVGQTGR